MAVSSSGVVLQILGDDRFPPPDPELDPYLDAFERVVQRFGFRRTTGRDVAQEAGVDRTTVFRNIGRLDNLYRLYIARELHRFIDGLAASTPAGLDGPGTIVEVVAIAIERAAAHPVLAKVLADEPDLVGELVPQYLDLILDQVVAALAPGLVLASGAGFIAEVDPDAMATWIARFGVTTLVAPTREPIRTVLDAVLRPVLQVRSA